MRDSEAFEERLGPSLDALFDGARLMVEDADRAEDLVVAVVLDASRRYGRPEVPADFRQWIIGRLVRRYRDCAELGPVRGPGARGDPGPGVPILERLVEGLSALQRATPERLREMIRRSLRALPPGERLSVWLVDVSGFSYPEAARVLGLSPSDFRRTLYSARRELQRLLAPAVGAALEGEAWARADEGEA